MWISVYVVGNRSLFGDLLRANLTPTKVALKMETYYIWLKQPLQRQQDHKFIACGFN